MTESGRYRRLTPVELERLNQFPDGHTEGLSDTQRAFLMGNALVVGVVKRIGLSLARHHSQENESFFSDTSPEVGLAAAD
jgi:DNA (cytosine-5)-methyltransferase 1